MKLRIHDIKLPLRHPFTIALGTTTLQHNLLIELEHEGIIGYGEASSSHAFHLFTPSSMRASLEAARPVIESGDFTTPEELWNRVLPVLGENRFALCGLDQAAHDLWGKREGAPVWKLWGLSLDQNVASDYTIGIDTIDKMVMKMKEFDGWPIYKIKLGTGDDLAIVRELRKHTDAVFRIDANTAWTAEQTLAYAPEMKELGVEFFEQPLKRDDWDGMKTLKGRCALPVIADESCQTEADVARCDGLYDGINIKLCKAGGMTPALRMIADARQRGLKVMIGCMTESSVGISAIGQLLPLLDYVDMDGAVLIATDIATGVRLEKGVAVYPEVNGNGVTLL
ncbi:dipeptide epimerase [Haloferula sp. BvORR071]|uniref:dipeptide epimerase n=1 Tax=Haloferula sp. BvORR071 TaxID=1396141 RepID=UPI00055855A2|nr:dipeptide epimerase [Haloferula sp. BvORR071]